MRLLKKFSDPLEAQKFSQLLHSQQIGNVLERHVNTDWGSNEYATQSIVVWIVDEDQVEKAQAFLEQFEQNPNLISLSSAPQEPPKTPSPQYPHMHAQNQNSKTSPNAVKKTEEKTGPITLYLIILCSILFIFTDVQRPNLERITHGLPITPLLTPPLEKELLFDYPTAYTYIDKIVDLYGPNKYETVTRLPQEGQALYKKFQSTPIWQGFYDYFLEWIHPPQDPTPVGAWIEKIREGEIWRLITPCCLHGSIFHLIFNMFALLVLGKAMEARMQKWRYLLFILATGILSNSAQYFMSGSNFIGFSGVLCAMLGFIWMRQKIAAWEGYPFQPGAFSFTLFFILAIALAQTASFLLQAAQMDPLPLNIANTAHLVGGLSGLLLGKLSFFEYKFKD